MYDPAAGSREYGGKVSVSAGFSLSVRRTWYYLWICLFFPFGEEKLVAPLIAIPNVDKANRRQEEGKKLN